MITPICDFITKYANSNAVRLHMPGHKGADILGVEKFDITEITGADVLSNASGIIAQSEQNASEIFGTKATFYSTEGSTLCIKTMLTIASQGRKKPYFIAGRNAHKAFVHACAMLDAKVEWIFSDEHLCSCKISDLYLEKLLKSAKNKVDAVYITTPDYLGKTIDIESIAKVCDKYSVPLLVDNAHGAYLKFLQSDEHPISKGATICCDSAHKTLPCLTGSAYLHFSPKAKDEWVKSARKIMSLYASTSPSYLILQSLDKCNEYLFENKNAYQSCATKVEELKSELRKSGLVVEPSEQLKVVINANKSGYFGEEIATILKQDGIQVEYFDKEFVVCMFSPQNEEKDYASLKRALIRLEKRREIEQLAFILRPKRKMSIRKAVFAKSETVDIKNAKGRICASPTVSCPPAVPVVVSGEIIDDDCIKALAYYGIEQVDVINARKL